MTSNLRGKNTHTDSDKIFPLNEAFCPFPDDVWGWTKQCRSSMFDDFSHELIVRHLLEAFMIRTTAASILCFVHLRPCFSSISLLLNLGNNWKNWYIFSIRPKTEKGELEGKNGTAQFEAN